MLLGRLKDLPVKLGDVAERMAQGIRTSANDIYVVDIQTVDEQIYTVYSKQLGREVQIEQNIVWPFLQGREIKRYWLSPSSKFIIVPYTIQNGKASLVSIQDMKDKFPMVFNYFQENKKYLEDREHGRMRGNNWYAYVYPKNLEVMSQPKILIPDIANHGQFALDDSGQYAFTSGYGITINKDIQLSPKYILGLLNSKLLDFYLKSVSTPMQNGYFRYFTQYIEQLPIRSINFSDPTDTIRYQRMVLLVEDMLALHKQATAVHLAQDKEMIQRQIQTTDEQIDQLVYELYGLTEEEIKIVEGE